MPRTRTKTRPATHRSASAGGSSPSRVGRAFGALAGLDVPGCFRLAPQPRVDIRQHVVPERHHASLGLRVEAPFGSLLGAREIVRVEQGLREVEVTGAEPRVLLYGGAKLRRRIGGPAVAREKLCQVEVRLIQLRADLDLIEQGSLRRVELLQFQPRFSKLDEKRRPIALEREAFFQRLGGCGKIP